jgi:hypothetical protein
LGYAINNVMIPFIRPPATTSMQLSTGVLLVASLVLLPVMLIVDGPVLVTDYSGVAIWATLWAGAANVIIFLVLFEIIRRAGPVFFSQFNYVVVAASVIWAFLIFADTFTLWVWGAIALMAVGLVLANKGANEGIKEAAHAADTPEDQASLRLDAAQELVVDLAERTNDDPGAPFEPDVIEAISVIRASDPASYARLKAKLKQVGVSMRDLEREIRRSATNGGAD